MENYKQNILLITFNRIDSTKLVLAEINKYCPSILYVSSDGGRNSEEILVVNNVRNYIRDNINCRIELRELYHDENLGCKNAVVQAIKWFFEFENSGIILEDDCLPSKSFFDFMNFNLLRYTNDDNVISVNGCNFGFHNNLDRSFKSHYMNMWGWGTWKRSAEIINYDISNSDILSKWYNIYCTLKDSHSGVRLYIVYFYWIVRFFRVKKIDTWDYYWLYKQFEFKKYSIVPGRNLVRNIGFNEYATHTNSVNNGLNNLSVFEIENSQFSNIDNNIIFEFENDFVTKRWESIKFLNLLKSIYVLLFK